MGFNTNTTDRLPSRQAIAEKEVFSLANLPAPVANVITLPAGFYRIKDDINFGLNRIDVPSGRVSLAGEYGAFPKVTYEGTGTFITMGGSSLSLDMRTLDMFLTGLAPQAIEATGLSSGVFLDTVDFNFTGGGGSTFATLTDVTQFTYRFGSVEGIKTLFNLTRVQVSIIDTFSSQADFATSGSLINVDQQLFTGVFRNMLIIANPGSTSIFNIDPLVNVPITITNVINAAGAPFFTAGDNGLITNIVDGSTPSLSVTAVNDVSGSAEYETSVAHNYSVGDLIFHTTFATGGYLGSKTVSQVNGATTYLTGDSFVIDETGNSIAPRATITATAHGQTLDTPVLISNTINFNGGTLIKNPLTNTFDIWLTELFPGTETSGNWDVGSLTEASKFIQAFRNGPQKDSMVSGGWDLSGNVVATTVASGVFNDFDFTGMTRLSYNERVNLVNFTNGTVSYEGLNPAVENIPVEFYMIPNNSTDREYDIKLMIDRGAGFIDLDDVIVTRINVKGVNTLFSTRRTVLLSPGDQYKWVQSGVATTNGFTAERGCSTI